MRRPARVPIRAPRTAAAARRASVAHVLVWVAQGVLAALFLFAGGMKLVLPAAALAVQSPLPGAFLRAVGALEVLGALGLVLPGLLRLRGELTALAAGGLLLLMCGAVGATLASPSSAGTPTLAIMPAAVGALAAAVAYARSRPVRHTRADAAPRASASRPAVALARPAA
jgi:hypothetical protein